MSVSATGRRVSCDLLPSISDISGERGILLPEPADDQEDVQTVCSPPLGEFPAKKVLVR